MIFPKKISNVLYGMRLGGLMKDFPQLQYSLGFPTTTLREYLFMG